MSRPQLTLIAGARVSSPPVLRGLRLVAPPPARHRARPRNPIPTLRRRRLALAALEDGIRTLLGTNPSFDGRPAKQREALAWVRSTSHHDPLGFEGVCATLRIDARRLRRRVVRVVRGLGLVPAE
ncbi:MAG TPA: hypothetical protein VGR62_04345 [Candidatus Binatia bacterium]|jgi:hypothetical protein|nr:hypothetical protein [Candidatus Binatia bacterium]